MNFEHVMTAIAQDMLVQFDKVTAQFSHRGLRGTSREEVVSEFLKNYLPANVEVIAGEIFDTEGETSPECDIIVIDRMRVPLLFARNKRLVPIEGVYSVLEVKSNLDSRELNDCFRKCERVKNLEKKAFTKDTGPIIHTFSAYGRELDHFPTLFSIFAYHGIASKTIAKAVEKWCSSQPAEKTIDSIICLDGWVLCWQNQTTGFYELTSSPDSRVAVLEAGKNSLLLFYLLYYRWLSQAKCDPIRMIDYANGALYGCQSYP